MSKYTVCPACEDEGSALLTMQALTAAERRAGC